MPQFLELAVSVLGLTILTVKAAFIGTVMVALTVTLYRSRQISVSMLFLLVVFTL